ncbi:unnamed protein product [Soboliphyme baturini]|uniref:Nucleolar protein 16 n=1 Tax=Soboliphyme baturini TaxID=241478 RepID=A0A183IHI3_9BILA|nr:unnamed protein product [Soboliphyme baturini]
MESEKEQPSVRRGRLSQTDLRYCIYLMEKYGEDYEAMAKDLKNVFQDSPGQIKQKIERFKKIPVQYNAYLRSRGLYKEGAPEAMETE